AMISLAGRRDTRAAACRSWAARIAARTTREIGMPASRRRAAIRASSGPSRTLRSFILVSERRFVFTSSRFPRSPDLVALDRGRVEREPQPRRLRHDELAALERRRLREEPERPRHVLDGEA